MLTALSIRNIVLIKSLDLEFGRGLCVLTGETGAGKSILLDALGLALGRRASADLVRQGEDRGTVTAVFALPKGHAASDFLQDQGLESAEGEAIIRRTLNGDGRSRCFINDQPVGVGILADFGALLVEIHGQHDERGLLNPRGHRDLLDAFASLQGERENLEQAHTALEKATAALESAEADLVEAERDRAHLEGALEELDKLTPEAGEEEELADRRALLMQAEKSAGDINAILDLLSHEDGPDQALRAAMRRLERIGGPLDSHVTPIAEGLHRAALEAEEATQALARLADELDYDPAKLEAIEERLFALRALARKHRCQVADLPELRDQVAEKLSGLKSGADELKTMQATRDAAAKDFERAVFTLREKRQAAAKALDSAVEKELSPLKLEKARFRTRIDELDRGKWGPAGGERVSFEISTNPGAPFGPLSKIASGGELSRFVLALKVALAGSGSAPTLIFDEVDRGVGGAVADAVGDRLKALSGDGQVLVVTHSPQVAACGDLHFRIEKMSSDGKKAVTSTHVARLASDDRREEIARMLSGAEITDEAREAARSLIEAAG